MNKNYSIRYREKTFRFIGIVLVIGFAQVASFAIYYSYKSFSESKNKIYIKEGNYEVKAFLKEDYVENQDVELSVKQQINDLHHYFGDLNPNPKQINNNITKALELTDYSGAQMYDIFKEKKKFYDDLIKQGYSCLLTTNDILVDFTQKPYQFEFRGTLKITRSQTILFRSFITRGYVRKIAPQKGKNKDWDGNDRGWMIEKWELLDFNDLKLVNRFD